MCRIFNKTTAQTFELDGWKYLYRRDSADNMFEVQPDQKTKSERPRPKTFFKYYGISENSVDALTGLYIYASHPNQLNDPLDCDRKIVNIDNHEDVDALFEGRTDFNSLLKMFGDEISVYNFSKEAFSEIMFKKTGILSLTDSYKNQALWSYYTENQGFCLELDVNEFPFRSNGPFPINYRNEIVEIFTSKCGIQLASLVQTNEKMDCWEHEKEWRLIVHSPSGFDMQSFDENGKKSQKYNLGDEHDRKFRYPLSALKSVTLGPRFFIDASVCTVNDYEIDVRFSRRTGAARVVEFLSEIQAKNFTGLSVRYARHSVGGKLDYLQVCVIKTDELKYRIMEIPQCK